MLLKYVFTLTVNIKTLTVHHYHIFSFCFLGIICARPFSIRKKITPQLKCQIPWTHCSRNNALIRLSLSLHNLWYHGHKSRRMNMKMSQINAEYRICIKEEWGLTHIWLFLQLENKKCGYSFQLLDSSAFSAHAAFVPFVDLDSSPHAKAWDSKTDIGNGKGAAAGPRWKNVSDWVGVEWENWLGSNHRSHKSSISNNQLDHMMFLMTLHVI